MPFRLRRLQYIDFSTARGAALLSLVEALHGTAPPACDAPPVPLPVAKMPAASSTPRPGRRAEWLGLAFVALAAAGGAVFWRSGLWTSAPDKTAGAQAGGIAAGRATAADGDCAAIIRAGAQLTAIHRGPRLTVNGVLDLTQVQTDGARGSFAATMRFDGQVGAESVKGEWAGAVFSLVRPDAEMQTWQGRCDRDGRIGGQWSWAHRPDDKGPLTIGP